VVTVIAHALGVVLLVLVRALQHLGCPSLHLFVQCWVGLCVYILRVLELGMRSLAQNGFHVVHLIGITSCFQLDSVRFVWAVRFELIIYFVWSFRNYFNFIHHWMKEGIREGENAIIVHNERVNFVSRFWPWILRFWFTLHNVVVWVRVDLVIGLLPSI
jgi:hypothetical protein